MVAWATSWSFWAFVCVPPVLRWEEENILYESVRSCEISCSAVTLLFLVLPFPIDLQEKKFSFLSWTDCWEEENRHKE